MREESLTIRFLRVIDQYQGLVDHLLESRLNYAVDLENGIDLNKHTNKIRKKIILDYLRATNGDAAEVAKLLHMGKTTLYVTMHRYGISLGNFYNEHE